ncbi:MAG: GIY-YIG nuclease family protein [Candidatus Heimdallarchaeota archaeon]
MILGDDLDFNCIKSENVIPGIYAIINIETGKVYIGQSMQVWNRLESHLGQLRRGSHSNNDLQKDFEKYGENSFKIRILYFIEREDKAEAQLRKELFDKEAFWLNSPEFDKHYNLQGGGHSRYYQPALPRSLKVEIKSLFERNPQIRRRYDNNKVKYIEDAIRRLLESHEKLIE